MADKIIWYSSSENPYKPGYVLIETIESTYYVDYIKSEIFDEWSDEIIRWAYIDDNNYAKYQNALSDVEYYKEENEKLKKVNEKLKKDVEDWFTKYVDTRLVFRKLYNKCQGDDTENARSTREMSINDIRDAYIRACVKETDKEIEQDLKPKIKREFLDDNCGSVNSDGDECSATDDLCEVCESDDARPVSEVSINEVRDIFLKLLREARERERAEEDDGK